MGIYPVTQSEYVEVMRNSPNSKINFTFTGSKYEHQGANRPADNVTWYDAIEFCNRLSVIEKLKPVYTIGKPDRQGNIPVTWDRKANGYRLPTEAEWEYACRGNTTTLYYFGKDITTKDVNFDNTKSVLANMMGIGKKDAVGSTTPVGKYKPNRYGLYDMHGNVWEWCWDWYGKYPSKSEVDPTGPSKGEISSGIRRYEGDYTTDHRVLRGGSWDSGAWPSAARFHLSPNYQGFNTPGEGQVGFRVVRNR
jgi:formylglycine-generating enzyme required for sulfatase activity